MAGYIGSKAVSLSTTAANVDGNITVTGNVDGRDVSVDGTKLDTIPIISTSSVASFTAKGDGSSQDGYIQLNCYQNTHGIKLKSPPHSAGASYTLVFPVNDGDAGQVLKTDGSGVLAWVTTSSTDNTKLPLAGGAMTGAITTNSTFDGVDIATRDAILTSTTTTASAALPKSGGAMTGAITTNSTFDGRDVAADGVLATNALPKSGGALTGVLSVPDGSTSSPSITNTGDLDTGISFPAINSIAISTAGTQRLVIDSAGFFDVTATGNDVARFSGLNSGSLVIRNDTANQVVVHTGTSDSLVFGTGGNNDRLTITSAGNVGVGVTPSDTFGFGKALDIGSAAGSFIYVRDTDATNAVGGIGISGTRMYITNKAAGPMTFQVNGDATERMRITPAGNVGIGTTTPQTRIHSTSSQEQLTLSEGDGKGATFDYRSSTGNLNISTNGANARSAPQLTLDLNGKVGIGTATPLRQLHISNTSANSEIAFTAGTSGTSSLLFGDGLSGTSIYRGYLQYQHNGDYMLLATQSTVRARLDADGIKFNADTAAANGLSDYEEGSWTPTLYQGITNHGVSTASGHYTKIGDMVNAYGRLSLNGAGSANSSQIVIASLPFGAIGGAYIATNFYINTSSGGGQNAKPLVFPSTTRIYMYEQSQSGVVAYSGNTGGVNFDILFNFTYKTG